MALIIAMFFILGLAFGMEAYKRWSRKNNFKQQLKVEITDEPITGLEADDFVVINSEGKRHAIVHTFEIHPGEYDIRISFHPF